MADCESCANFFESPICSTCENGSDFKEVVMTNADSIRSMNDEELVEWIFRHDTKTHCYGRLNREELLKWLQSEAE